MPRPPLLLLAALAAAAASSSSSSASYYSHPAPVWHHSGKGDVVGLLSLAHTWQPHGLSPLITPQL